jgi:hypothetical protein
VGQIKKREGKESGRKGILMDEPDWTETTSQELDIFFISPRQQEK